MNFLNLQRCMGVKVQEVCTKYLSIDNVKCVENLRWGPT